MNHLIGNPDSLLDEFNPKYIQFISDNNIRKPSDIFTIKKGQKYKRFLELISSKSTQVTEQIFKSVDLSNTSYLYQSLYNSSINVDDLRDTVGGIYFEENDSVKRIFFALLKKYKS